MNPAGNDASIHHDLETALTGLVKLVKALNYYPADHPALQEAAEETCDQFQPLLARHDTRPYHVTQDGFSLDDEPLAPANQSLQKLAFKLVERRVRQLLFLPELADHELLGFAEELSKPADQLFKEGGLPKRLAARGIKAIWINETDLEKILASLQESSFELTGNETWEDSPSVASESPAPMAQSAVDDLFQLDPKKVIEQMRNLLELLKEPLTDEVYQQQLDQVGLLADSFLEQTGIAGRLALFGLLNRQRLDPQRSDFQRSTAAERLDKLLDRALLAQLADDVSSPHLKGSQKRALARLLVGLQQKAAPALLSRLHSERDAVMRRSYVQILAHMGPAIFDLLHQALQDTSWYVVRNAVAVLGESRQEQALPLLLSVVKHPEVRVRRALIRALGAIGGPQVIKPLLELSRDPNAELHQPAIMALGNLKTPEAIQPLAAILGKTDLFSRQGRLKLEAVRALGATGSPYAIIPLLKVARRGNLFRLNTLEALRAEAILALGQVGNDHLVPVLKRLPKSNKGPVSRALKQVTSQLQKSNNVS